MDMESTGKRQQAKTHPLSITLLSIEKSAIATWRWRIRWEHTSMKFWKKWERKESLILAFTIKLSLIRQLSRRRAIYLATSPPNMMKSSTQTKVWTSEVCFTVPRTWTMAQSNPLIWTCQRNIIRDQKHSLRSSWVVISMIRDSIRSKPRAARMVTLISER